MQNLRWQLLDSLSPAVGRVWCDAQHGTFNVKMRHRVESELEGHSGHCARGGRNGGLLQRLKKLALARNKRD